MVLLPLSPYVYVCICLFPCMFVSVDTYTCTVVVCYVQYSSVFLLGFVCVGVL